MLQFMGSQRVRHHWVTEQQNQQQASDHTSSRTLGIFFFFHCSAMATEVNSNKTPMKVFICILFLFQNKMAQYHSPQDIEPKSVSRCPVIILLQLCHFSVQNLMHFAGALCRSVPWKRNWTALSHS